MKTIFGMKLEEMRLAWAGALVAFACFASGCVSYGGADEPFPKVTVEAVFAPEGETNVRSSFHVADGAALIGTEESADIFKTEDDGFTWRKVFDGSEALGLADVRTYMRAQDGGIYFTTSEPATITRSMDEGETWEKIYDAPASRTVGLTQLDDGTFLVGLRRSENNMTSIVRTEDAFETAEVIVVSETEPRQNTTCFGYWGGETILVGVGYEGPGKIYRSTDGGKSWTKTAQLEGPRDLMQFFKAGDSIFLLSSGISTLFRSDDDGLTWAPHHQFWEKGFLGDCEPFSWKGRDYLIMAATDQRESSYRHLIMISDDQGETWHEWINLVTETAGAIYSSKDSGGGASNLAVISDDTIIVGVGNHSVQGRVYTLRVSDKSGY